MADTVARALGALALVGLLANGVLLVRLDRHVAALQRRAPAEARPRSRPVTTDLRGAPEPEPPETPAQPRRRRPRREAAPVPAPEPVRRREPVSERVDAFTRTHTLPAATEAAIREEALLFEEGMGAVRDDVMEGLLTPREGREEIRAMAEDSDARMVDLLGEPLAAELRVALSARRSGPDEGVPAPSPAD